MHCVCTNNIANKRCFRQHCNATFKSQAFGFFQMGGSGYKPEPAMERNAPEAYFLTMLEGCVDKSSTILTAPALPILIRVFIISDIITKS